MIVRKNLSWRRIAQIVAPQMAALLLLSLVVTVLHQGGYVTLSAAGSTPLTLIGTVLSIFLGFKTNAAYDRWWEARTLWGGIVNQSRTWARKLLMFSEAHERGKRTEAEVRAFERDLVYLQIAFVNAARCHLRKQDPFPEIAPFLPGEEVEALRGQQNVPAALLMRMGARVKGAYQSGILDLLCFLSLNDTLTEMTNLLGGCERIKNTPLARQYDYFPKLFVYTYCFVLPFGIVNTVGWATPLASVVVGFLFFTLDSIGRNISDPFENTINDTPMTALCRTIEINLRQALGEAEIPAPHQPVDGFLF